MHPPIPAPIRIGILVFPESVGASAAAPFDVFKIANTLSLLRPAAEQVRFEVSWVSRHGGVVSNLSGLSFATTALEPGFDAVIVTGVDRHVTREIVPAIRAMTDEMALLRDYAAGGGIVSAMCTGTFVLAEAGLLVGSSRVDLQACKLEYSIVSPK